MLGIIPVIGTLATQAAVPDKVNFNDHVKPIFNANCNKCHNPDKAKGGLDLTSVSAILAGGGSGVVAKPGDPDGSLLYQSMAHLAEPFMPSRAPKRPDEELETVKRWLAQGMPENAGGGGVVAKKTNLALLDAGSAEKPEGPPPMPVEVVADPVDLAPRANAIRALAASPWAPLIAVGASRQVLLYHSELGRLEGVLPFAHGEVTCVRFSRNGAYLVAGGGVAAKSGKAVLYEIRTGRVVAEVGDDFDSLLACDVSSDLKHIATGSPDKWVRIYETATGRILHRMRKHTEWLTALAFSPDGVLLASGDRNGGLQVWETESAQEFYTLRGHEAAITDIAWRRDSNLMASASEDGSVRLWNMGDGGEAKNWKAHDNAILSVDFAPDGALVTSGRDRTAVVWDANGQKLAGLPQQADLVLRARFVGDGSRIVTGNWLGEARIFNRADGAELRMLNTAPAKLEDRLAEARKAVETQQALLTPVEQQKSEAVGRLSTAQAAVGKAKEQEAAAAAEIARLDGVLAAAKQARDAAERERGELAGRIDAAGKALQDAVAARQAADALLVAARSTLEAKRAAVAAAESVLGQAEQRRKELGEKRDQAVQVVSVTQAGVEAANAAAEAGRLLSEAEAAAQQAATALESARGELSPAEGVVAAAEKALNALEATRQAAEKATQELQAQVAGADAKVAEAVKAMEAAGAQRQQAGQSADAARIAREGAEAAEAEQKKQLVDVGGRVEAETAKLTPLVRDLRHLEASVFIRDRLTVAKKERETKQAELDAKAAEVAALKQAEDQARAAAQAAEASLGGLQAELEKIRAAAQ